MPAGRQARTLLGALSRRWDELTAISGPFTLYIAIAEPGPATWAYDPSQLAESRRLITVRGGQIIPFCHDTRAMFWSAPVWQHLSDAAASSSLPQGPAGEPGAVVPPHVAAFRIGRNVGYAERLSRPIQDDDGERALASPVLRHVRLDA